MATESYYQSKIMKRFDGFIVNGNYTKAGIPDLLGCLPEGRFIAIEVKTPENYIRVMRAVYEVDELYRIKPESKALKKHEALQVKKINDIRKLGGLALFASDYEQVEEYIIKKMTKDQEFLNEDMESNRYTNQRTRET